MTWKCQWEKSRPSRGAFLQITLLTTLCNPKCQRGSLLETSRTLEDIELSSFSEEVRGLPLDPKHLPIARPYVPMSMVLQLGAGLAYYREDHTLSDWRRVDHVG